MKNFRTVIAVPLTAVATLMLAACGGPGPPVAGGQGGEEAPSQNEDAVYDFEEVKQNYSADDETPFVATNQTVRVQPPEDLLAAVPDGMSPLIEQFTLTPKAFETGMCRLDVGIVWADGGEQALRTAEPDDEPGSALMGALTGAGLQDKEPEDRIVDAVPTDDEIQEGGRYVTEDLQTVTFVDECSGYPDDDNLVSLNMPYMQDIDEKFAWLKVSVMDDGQNGGEGTSVTILGSTDAKVSPNGSWQTRDD